jgi:hypothetical protein
MTILRFFEYACEREHVRRKKESGLPKPWTRDLILKNYRFCNVFREDDRTTQWFRRHMRDHVKNSTDAVFTTICFRWFNRISTGEVLLEHNLHHRWDGKKARRVLADCKPLVTAAYMVKSPIGVNPKLEGLAQCLDTVWSLREALLSQWDYTSLENSWCLLLQLPYIGPFMAYEIVTDLRHTIMLERARDIDLWANPGPGCVRGLGRVFFSDPLHFVRNRKSDQESMQIRMRHLLVESRQDHRWPKIWPKWEMREVEHTLCEFDKYERARLGEGRPKQRYSGVE